jgi:hypothetical protein
VRTKRLTGERENRIFAHEPSLNAKRPELHREELLLTLAKTMPSPSR